MSTPSSAPDAAAPAGAKPKRTGLFRWKGIIPMAIIAVVLVGGWKVFGARLIKSAITQGGTSLLESQVDVAGLSIHMFPPSVDLRGFAIADNDNLMRNRLVLGRARIEVEALPLFQKKVVIKNITVADVQTGSARTVRATFVPPDTSGGVMSDARDLMRRVKVPTLSLAPLDSLKELILNPMDLKAVQAALALAQQADSAKQLADRGYAALNLQPTIDSSAALAARMKDINVRTLGLDGARKALADLRRGAAQVDSAKKRVERLASDTRRSMDSLQALVGAMDDARRDDYASARALLKLPSFEAPDIGLALFGSATLERFQKAVRYATLARKYAPPGLLPKESAGPKRMRMAGSTVHFVTQESFPRFLLRRMELNLVGNGDAGVDYSAAAADVTSDPAIIGRPTLFVARRVNRGRVGDSVRVSGSLDHTRDTPRDIVNVVMGNVTLPTFTMPMLPYSIDAGAGTSSMRFVLEGERLSGTWTVKSQTIAWRPDSARARPLNTMESLVARALTGINTLEVTADIGGTLKAPTLGVRSNLDRVVAERVRAIAGEEIAAAEKRLRAQVDKIVDERSAPVKARVAEVRAESERNLAEARARLDEEKAKLEERIKAMAAGINLPRLP
jgi:uncharacterized protein (TIGR03545 family)